MQAVVRQKGELRFPWLFSRTIDLSIFYLPVLVGFAVYGLAQANIFGHALFFSFLLFQAFGLADFHIGATWFHYFDRRNWRHYTASVSNTLTYVVAPLAFILVTPALQFIHPAVVFSLFVLWTVQHLVKQNIGILLLHHIEGDARVDRDLEVGTQHWAAIFFSLLFARRLVHHNQFQDVALQMLILAALVMAVALIAKYIVSLVRHVNRGAALNVPALGFWLLSVLFLAPFAFMGKDIRGALVISQMVHWFQYVGLNFVLAKRKYADGQAMDLPLRHPMMLFFLTGATISILLLIIAFVPEQSAKGPVANLMVGLIYGVAFAHYWQDSFIWRFREPFNRQMMLPYLKANLAVTPPANVPKELAHSGAVSQ